MKKHELCDESKKILKSDLEDANYNAYIGKSQKNICSQKDFCKYLFERIKNIQPTTKDEEELIRRIEESRAFPKQVSKENGVIPYQLNLYELEKILENAEKYLPFLLSKDKDELTVSDKIKSLFVFKIPYYVGPLNPHSKFSWIVKMEGKEGEKISPWNFDEVVDKEQSADRFILKMTNQCSYLKGEDVLPKQSVLYSKFNILNQLNNIRVNGEKLPVVVKQELYRELFCNVEKPRKVTVKGIADFLKIKGFYEKEIDITGMDTEISANLKAMIDFRRIVGQDKLKEEIIDEIIQKIIILGESGL